MATSITDQKHPYYEDISKFPTEEVVKYFTDDNSFRMRYVSLGEALDFTSFGGLNYVVWPKMNHREMIKFIGTWMEHQQPRVEFERIPNPKIERAYTLREKSREFNYTWNRFYQDYDVKLPYINREECSTEGHQETVRDLAGRLRCANKEVKRFKPSFTIGMRDGDRIRYFEDEPARRLRIEDYDEIEDTSEIDQFDQEERSLEVADVCYAIISDVGTYLPLEGILKRLDVNNFRGEEKVSVFPFSGFKLANYVKAWWNQPGENKFFLTEGEEDNYRAFPDFELVSSDD